MRLFVKGKPSVITIDDYLPFMNGSPIFAKKSGDNDMWVGLLEKAFAKVSSNYENTNFGWQAESWRILTGAPSRFYIMSSINNDPNQAWNIISDALSKNFPVGVDTPSNPPFGLVAGHAYTIDSSLALKDTAGNIAVRLLRIRNTWGRDVYSGPWNDNDSRWTTFYKSQVPGGF